MFTFYQIIIFSFELHKLCYMLSIHGKLLCFWGLLSDFDPIWSFHRQRKLWALLDAMHWSSGVLRPYLSTGLTKPEMHLSVLFIRHQTHGIEFANRGQSFRERRDPTKSVAADSSSTRVAVGTAAAQRTYKCSSTNVQPGKCWLRGAFDWAWILPGPPPIESAFG